MVTICYPKGIIGPKKRKGYIVRIRIRLLTALFAGTAIFLSGCGLVGWVTLPQRPYDSELLAGFRQTRLKESSSADVLSYIHYPEYGLLSQSENAVASAGQDESATRTWFTMVAFDEDQLTASAKYLLIVDEKAKGFWTSRRKCHIEAALVVAPELLEEPFANENARRIALLGNLLARFEEAVEPLRKDSAVLDSAGMLFRQTFNGILARLEDSPALASQLTDYEGMPIDHLTLGKGRIRMTPTGDLLHVTVKIGPGSTSLEDM